MFKFKTDARSVVDNKTKKFIKVPQQTYVLNYSLK